MNDTSKSFCYPTFTVLNSHNNKVEEGILLGVMRNTRWADVGSIESVNLTYEVVYLGKPKYNSYLSINPILLEDNGDYVLSGRGIMNLDAGELRALKRDGTWTNETTTITVYTGSDMGTVLQYSMSNLKLKPVTSSSVQELRMGRAEDEIQLVLEGKCSAAADLLVQRMPKADGMGFTMEEALAWAHALAHAIRVVEVTLNVKDSRQTDKVLAELVKDLKKNGYVPDPKVWNESISYVEYMSGQNFSVIFVSAMAPEHIKRAYDIHPND